MAKNFVVINDQQAFFSRLHDVLNLLLEVLRTAAFK
jgi:hypothetical protein